MWTANPIDDTDTFREFHLKFIKSLLCINVLSEPSLILGKPVFIALKEIFFKSIPEQAMY